MFSGRTHDHAVSSLTTIASYSVKKLFIAGVFIALISAALVGCASQSNSNNSGSGHTGSPQNCGKLQTDPRGSLANTTANTTAVNCFWQAYQHCQPASITYTASGMDAGAIRTFTVENSASGCVVKDAMQHYIAPQPASPATVYTCSSVVHNSAGLSFTCGNDGVITIALS